MKAYAIIHRDLSLETRGRAQKWQRGGLLLLLLSSTLVGCTTSRHTNQSADSHSHHGHSKLELDNGRKWVVVEPMMLHIRNLGRAVNEFDPANGDTHQALAADIQENLGRLVTSCTMEGKAHDELHKWLIPFLALSTEYLEATETAIQKGKFGEIKHALATFDTYFE